MLTFPQKNIEEIAEQLDCGFQAFYHRQTGELLFVPDPDKFPDMDTESWDEEFKKLENNMDDYAEIVAMDSNESFQVMADFTNQLSDKNPLKQRLIFALNKKKPFREFKYVIDGSDIYREQWFEYKNARLHAWVISQLDN